MKPVTTDDRRGTPIVAIILGLILVASLAISIVFANPSRIPLNGNPDEVDHRDYVRLLIQHHGFVKFTPAPFDMPSTDDKPRPFETHQPPLYYLLCVPVQIMSGGSVFAVRMVAAILQLLTILVVFRALRDVFPERPAVYLGGAAYVAFLPSQAQLSGAITNDSLTTLLCAVLFWKLARLFRRDRHWRDSVLIGVTLGVGLLTKSSVLQLIPIIAVAFAFSVWLGRRTARQAVLDFCIAIGIGLLIAAPWLIRNILLYGDPLALHIFQQTGPAYLREDIMTAFGWSFGDYARNVGVRSFATFWYLLDPNLPLRHFTGDAGPLVVVLVLALVSLFGVYKGSKQGEGAVVERRFLGFCILAILIIAPFFLKFVLTYFQAQGRYFLPVLLPAAAVTAAGWAAIVPARRGAIGVGVMILLLIGLCLLQMRL